MRIMNVRLLRLVALLLLLGGATSAAVHPGTAGAAEKPAVVIHESVWDSGERDSWSAFTIRVSSEDGFNGELRLVSTPFQQRVQQIPGQPPPAPPDPGPSISTPITLEPGVERLVSVMAPIGEAAYRAEVREPSGKLVFAGQARRALSRTAFNVGLLTDRRSGDALFQVGSSLTLSISRRFRSAADFPSDALSLEGLEAIVIADFDSGTLSAEQRQALQDFVALGGTLITTGGDASARTVGPLPEALVPLRPDATAQASLAPLVDILGETTTAVTTGELRSGRAVIGGVSGPPLVVEALHGLGRIVQLAYDPYAVLAEQRNATGALRSLPWSVGLLRAAPTPTIPPNTNATQAIENAGPPAPEWAALDRAPGPKTSKGGPAGLLLLAYPLIMGGVAFVLSRERGKPPWRWAAVPALAVVVTAATLPFDWGLRASPLTGDEVTVERIGGAGSPARVESFHRLVPSTRDDVGLRLGRGTLATTAPSPRPPLVLPPIPPTRGGPPGPSGDAVVLGEATQVQLGSLLAWDARRLHTLSLAGQGGWIEAHLRLQAGRMVGTLANRGDRPVRRVRVQAPDGARAELAAELAPGASIQVDAAFGTGEPPRPGDSEAGVLDTVAASEPGELRPGELALAGLLPDQPGLGTQKSYRRNTAHRALLTTVELEAADAFVLDFGTPRAVCCGTTGQGAGGAGVYELRLPTGLAGPFALEQTDPSQASIYDWASGTWRPVPNQRQGQAQTPIAPTEIKDGLVQVRASQQGPTTGLRAVAAPPAG
ncbi:MAG: hypothetical protein WKF86_00390 [Acidimicrobiales bacterium]